ncbi:DUF2513 domain-containing protein [Anabaena sp. CCY 0017]|uniref:DUF2513 domain-containing protein n=1 Tax=Anabaena sp. CCY 0017 TaxID=3103866 RepID=UPI0039C67635
MKRDMDLIRKIILNIEANQHGFANHNFQIEGYTSEQISYHSYLIIQGGLAEGITTTNVQSSSPTAIIRNLTWQGHEFADAARNDSIWHKAMERIKEKGDAVPISVLTQLLISIVKTSIGLP